MSRYIWGVLLRATEAVWEDVNSLSKEAVAMLKSMGAGVGKVDTRGVAFVSGYERLDRDGG